MDNNCINTLPHHLVPNSKIIIQTVWNDDSVVFKLYVSDAKQGFRGTLLKTTLAKTAERFELNVDEFMAESKAALCTQNGLPNFTYILDPSNTFKFCKSTEKGFRITYGEVSLVGRPDSIEEILMDSIGLNKSKDQQIEVLHADIRGLDEKFNEVKAALEKLVEEKVQMEISLLTKFAALLNSKKEKITELERAIKNRLIVADDDCDESDGSGDSDPDYSSQTYVRDKSPAPSTSVQPDVLVVPKRSRNQQNVTIAEETNPTSSTTEPMDIYDRDTEVFLDDM